MFPTSPPPAGSPDSSFDGSSGERHSLKTIGPDHWIIGSRNRVGTEIRRLTEPESGFSFLRTDGKNAQEEHVAEWSDLGAFF